MKVTKVGQFLVRECGGDIATGGIPPPQCNTKPSE